MVILHFLLLLVSCFLAQSPHEVAVSGNIDKVVQILAKLRKCEKTDVLDEAEKIMKAEQDKEPNLFKFQALFKVSFKKLSIILMVFSFTHLSGITVITTFLVDIFSSFGIAEIVLVTVSSVSEIVFSFLQILVANRIGR